jgi:hypothetical protein
MEHFIESNDLGERFDEFLLNTAEEENSQEYREPAPNERQADGSRHTPASLFAAQMIDANKCDHTLRLLKIDKLAREEVERSLFEDGIIEDPGVDGGLMG